MPIEHKFGVPISALGRMAYAVGAGEAAKKRALEDRERRMQMMRMQQQQQEAARGRQFDAWKNQYQHGSAMQRMQADHEWKDNFEKRGQEHQKTRFDHETEVRFKNDTELNKLRGAENERVNRVDHLQAMERDLERAKTTGDQGAIRRAEIEYEVSMRSVQAQCRPEGVDKFTEYNGQISNIMTDDRLNDKQKKDKVQGVRKQQMELPKLYPKLINHHGYHNEGEVFTTDNVNGRIVTTLSPGATTEGYKAAVSWKPERQKDKDGLWETTLEVKYDADKEAIVPVSGRNFIGESSEQQNKTRRAREEHRGALAGQYFKVDHEKVYDEATGTDRMSRRVSITASGEDAARRAGIPNFNPANPDHQRALMNFGMSQYDSTERDARMDADAGEPGWDMGGRGGPPGDTGDPGGLFNVPSEGQPGQAGVPVPQPGAAPAERVAVEQRGAAQDPRAAHAAKLVDEESIAATAVDLSQDFSQEAENRVRPEEGLIPTGYQDDRLPGMSREEILARRGDPRVVESRLRQGQLEHHQELTERGESRDAPGASAERAAGQYRSPITGGPAPNLAGSQKMGLNWVDPGAVIAKGLAPVEAVGKGVRSAGEALKTVAEKAVKAPLKARVARIEKSKKSKKSAAESAAAHNKVVSDSMYDGTPGAKITMPQVRKGTRGWEYRDATKARDRDEYDKFNKELRNYAHRLKNNKDASKDVKMRLDRIKKQGKNITKKDLEDELRVIKVIGRVAGASKKSAAWKSFLSKDQWWAEKAFPKLRAGLKGVYPTGKAPHVSAEKILKKDVDTWVTGMSRLVKTLEDMGL